MFKTNEPITIRDVQYFQNTDRTLRLLFEGGASYSIPEAWVEETCFKPDGSITITFLPKE